MYKKIGFFFIIVAAILLGKAGNASCAFDVDWGVSWDDGVKGDQHVAQWLVGNGYMNNVQDALTFAQTGYIGYDTEDPDAFYWNSSQPFNFQIVQELAGFSDQNVLGYYTGNGSSKSMTQIFGGTDSGPRMMDLSEPFGLYLSTPKVKTWFTDRAENIQQAGSLKQPGGSPQALIYELKPDTEWLVAWEDLDASRPSQDRDYNDMYLRVTVVPEPVSSVLFLLGGGVVAAAVRKRKK